MLTPFLMLKNKAVVIVSSIDWNFNWQGPQEIARRLSESGCRVLYIENTGIRSPKLKDSGRVYRRIRNWFSNSFLRKSGNEQQNLFVHSPLVLPPFGSKFQRLLNQTIFLPLIGRISRKLQLIDPVIITFLLHRYSK